MAQFLCNGCDFPMTHDAYLCEACEELERQAALEEAECEDADGRDREDDGLSDVEADAMTLRDAGYGMDEDYNHYEYDYDDRDFGMDG